MQGACFFAIPCLELFVMESNKLKISGPQIQALVFGVILVLLFFLVCRLFAPFFTIMLWSVLLYIVVDPLYQKAVKNIDLKKKRGQFLRILIAGVFALFSVLAVCVPLSLVISQLYIQGLDVLKHIKNYILQNKDFLSIFYSSLSEFVSDKTGNQIALDPLEIHNKITTFIEGSVQSVIKLSGTILREIGIFIIGLALIVFCLFFFFLDAPVLSSFVRDIMLIRKDYVTTIVEKFKEITRSLLLGYVTVALIQSTLAFIVFSIFKVDGALVFACLTFVCVFIPMLGGALVWLPIGISRIASGDIAGGILLTIVSGVTISMLDNFLRPFFLQNRLQLHPLIIFFSIMGGLALFGFNGLILGPLIIVIFLTVLELFVKEYHIVKDKSNQVLNSKGSVNGESKE
jgi:predicted PurR-regulated permease PerM